MVSAINLEKHCVRPHVENCCIATMVEEDDPGAGAPGSVSEGALDNAQQVDVEEMEHSLGVPDTTSNLEAISCCLACRKDQHKQCGEATEEHWFDVDGCIKICDYNKGCQIKCWDQEADDETCCNIEQLTRTLATESTEPGLPGDGDCF